MNRKLEWNRNKHRLHGNQKPRFWCSDNAPDLLQLLGNIALSSTESWHIRGTCCQQTSGSKNKPGKKPAGKRGKLSDTVDSQRVTQHCISEDRTLDTTPVFGKFLVLILVRAPCTITGFTLFSFPAMQMLGWYLDYTMATSFWILSNLCYIKYPTILTWPIRYDMWVLRVAFSSYY
jgi:hypothetical protein